MGSTALMDSRELIESEIVYVSSGVIKATKLGMELIRQSIKSGKPIIGCPYKIEPDADGGAHIYMSSG